MRRKVQNSSTKQTPQSSIFMSFVIKEKQPQETKKMKNTNSEIDNTIFKCYTY